MNKKNKIIGSSIIAAILCIFTIVGYIKANKNEDYGDIFVESSPASSAAKESNTTNVSSSSSKYVKVEIKGEIQKPGVYTMNYGSRLEDLILKAGGLTEKADKERLPSMAKKLRDEECILVPDKTAPAASSAAPAANTAKSSENDLININTAGKDELEKIPGVGPVTAQKIIDYREKHGEFQSIEDMKNISGIGDKTLEKMKEKITVN